MSPVELSHSRKKISITLSSVDHLELSMWHLVSLVDASRTEIAHGTRHQNDRDWIQEIFEDTAEPCTRPHHSSSTSATGSQSGTATSTLGRSLPVSLAQEQENQQAASVGQGTLACADPRDRYAPIGTCPNPPNAEQRKSDLAQGTKTRIWTREYSFLILRPMWYSQRAGMNAFGHSSQRSTESIVVSARNEMWVVAPWLVTETAPSLMSAPRLVFELNVI
ncbi:hypothetical protein DEU56DRAFT_759847 [Suillus clintonianus]|uniref:uncharacterized protein n=1 Tax=Suillus clintonianus TaxID=1904413 RepID=UPI001B8716B7|nr:uncharacterized protein DEU56DRAFT_759847 [Suillus clintonianus]KAG2123993.1 hypothetical protein DEU56DRAFT_759847 [Suillus clintonianus]